jgi:hypothetical protein
LILIFFNFLIYLIVQLNVYFNIYFNILVNHILFLIEGKFVILNLHIFLSSHFLFTFTQIKQPKNHLTFYQLSINFLSFNILSFNFLSFKFLFLSKHTLKEKDILPMISNINKYIVLGSSNHLCRAYNPIFLYWNDLIWHGLIPFHVDFSVWHEVVFEDPLSFPECPTRIPSLIHLHASF